MRFLHHTASPRALAPLAIFAGALLFAGCGNNGADNTTATTDGASNTSATGSNSAGSDNTASGGNTASTGGATETTGKSADAGMGGPAKPSAKKLKLAFVCNNASDYWTIARKGTEKAQEELGPNVSIEFKLPSEGTASQQTQLVNDLVATGIDGMAISPVDAANQGDALNSAAAKTLVFTQDSDAPTSKRVCYVGTDNVAAGHEAGKLVKRALPQGGKIMAFVGKIDAQNAKDRYQGLQDELKGTKIEFLQIRTDDTNRGKAKSNVTDALVANPDLKACVGLWSYNTPAILSAVKDAKKVGQVQIIGFDEEDDTLDGVASGAIIGTIVQQPYRFGYLAIVNMTKYLNGDKSVIPASKQVNVPTRTIDKTTVEDFRAELKKLRGK